MSEPKAIQTTMDGNAAAAHIAYRVNEVCAIYPITPSSPMAELADEWTSKGITNIWGNIPVIQEIAETGKLLAFHVGADAIERTHPFRVGKIAKQFPHVQILMVHMGGVAFADLSNAAIEVAQEHQNLTLIGSGVRPRPILKAIKTLGASRVCFGSDTPFELMHVEIAKYNALLEGEVSEDDRYKVMAGNMIRLLELKV